MTFKSFEDIEAWQLAREMCKTVKALTDKESFSKDWELKKQIKNSSGSAMDCIAEGYERGNNAEFLYFLGISKGSSGEVRSQAYRALDYGYIDEPERAALNHLAKQTGAAIQGLIDYLNRTEIKGQRYPKKPLSQPKPQPKTRFKTENDDPNFPSEPPPN